MLEIPTLKAEINILTFIFMQIRGWLCIIMYGYGQELRKQSLHLQGNGSTQPDTSNSRYRIRCKQTGAVRIIKYFSTWHSQNKENLRSFQAGFFCQPKSNTIIQISRVGKPEPKDLTFAVVELILQNIFLTEKIPE